MPDAPVRAWRESVTIPTYGIGAPDRNPMFLEKRVYQGSSGAVYPYPVIDRIADEKHERPWEAIFLENAYLKIMVMPELGGRVQMAVDKTNDYPFVYYNRVIKPALVGLAGPWISGGIEFNWPQHHRPNTFGPVATEIVEHADGSITVWCNEIDRMHRTRGMHGLTLHPDRAYLEVRVRLDNRTALPQTFLWWANPACHVDEHHQSIFPPDVHAVMDHGKRDVSSFPIATGEYYKVDYAPGTDISRYRNIPVPTSYMAHRSRYDFVGSYDHRREAGLLHIANHHIAPGKKQWTWGHGDFGQAWDRHLTDDDGPYIELMCGVYTDNQPDFSWLMPGEARRFSQYFMPYKGVGVIRNATLDAAVGLEVDGSRATVRVYTTGVFDGARVALMRRGGGAVVREETFDATPQRCFEATAMLPDGVTEGDLEVVVRAADGRQLVRYAPPEIDRDDLPEPAEAIGSPASLDSVESLYLAGVHLEQYRHATREAMDYYAEALRRDPGDARCNAAMGRLLHRRGRFEEAAPCFERAIERQTRHNPNPRDGEPYYNLGIALVLLERFDDAEDALWKATWNHAWQSASYFELARLAARRGDHRAALERVDAALHGNDLHQQALHLKAYLLAALDAPIEQIDVLARRVLAADAFNAGVLYEAARRSGDFAAFDDRMRDDEHAYLELAIDYAAFGAYDRAVDVLRHYLDRVDAPATPMPDYYLADYLRGLGGADEATQHAQRAATRDPAGCFPNRLEEIAILESADATDARAAYYLGNLWYDKRQYDCAIDCWERARRLDPAFPTAWRNLGLARFNKRGDAEGAWEAFNEAFALDPTDARVFFELDQLAKRLGHDPAERLARLEAHAPLVELRDDLALERITLLNQLRRHDEALEAVLSRRFHPWEGGEGKVPAQFVLAVSELARSAIDEERSGDALDLLARAEHWPQSLGEGKLAGIQENNLHYLRGVACRGLGRTGEATAWLERAAIGLAEPTSPMYYNDQPPDMIFYQGLALRALGREGEARQRFASLVAYGEAHLDDDVTIDYFAVSLPDFLVFEDDLTRRHKAHCRYMMALGRLGLGDRDRADAEFAAVLALDVNHLGAIVHRDLIDADRSPAA